MSCDKNQLNCYFNDSVIRIVKNEIKRAFGNEVLFFGWTDEDSRVKRIEVIARGNEECVVFPIEKSFLPDVVIHNHPNGNLSPSGQDLNIAAITANRGVGFFIINNDVTEIYAAVEPVIKDIERPVDAEKLKALISKGGPFSSTIPGFEEREGQKEMVEYVCESFNEGSCALIEAGTGIGKSLAYLIPAVEWSKVNMERVVISTNTINLQEQLLHKDIPDLRKALDSDFSYILMKGRGNYICLNKMYEVQQDLFSLIDDKELEQFNSILIWINKTEDGSLSDLTFIPGPSLWDKLNSRSETCLGGTCEYFSRCFVNRIRRKAVTAGIIVTNHHYLLADACLIESGTSILPSYDRVIFDEAHSLEDSATSFFTKTITLQLILRLLNRLYSGEKKKKGYLMHMLRKGDALYSRQLNRTLDGVKGLRAAAYDLFEGMEEFLNLVRNSNNGDRQQNNYAVCEVTDEVKNHPRWDKIVIGRLDIFYKECSRLSNSLFELREEIAGSMDERVLRQIEGFILRLTEIIQTVDIFLNEEDSSYVRWIEKKRETALVVSLIDVGSALNKLIVGKTDSAVFTSATLTVDGKFDFLRKRLSLTNPEISVIIASPFRYDEQMTILIPSDVAGPGHPDYISSLEESILRTLKKTGGKAFVLFTSYKTLNEVYGRIKNKLEEIGLFIFRQGSDSRGNLLIDFKNNIHSVLFGTESFWQGVDAPGETLECVIMTKLPFKVPSEPVTRARIDQIRAGGGNPFMEYLLPLAVIKMKQGIGRLIRKKTDKGIIVILDRRILMKSYGTVFINSIPGGNISSGSLDELLKKTDMFISNNSLTK